MRAIIQKVSKCDLYIENKNYSSINKGLLVLLGVSEEDNDSDLQYILKKTLGMRIFSDQDGKMNLSLDQVDGNIMVVSQFTLYGDVRKGNRPSFSQAAKGSKAEEMYKAFVLEISKFYPNVQTGKFGAHMEISLVNDGPVTIMLDSKKNF